MRRSTRLRLALAVAAAVTIGASMVGISGATFTSTTSNPTSSFGAKHIFPRVRSTSAWTLRDSSNGTEQNSDDALSYAGDARTTTTGTWTSSFASNRYVEFDFSGSTATGVAVSSVQFNFKWAANATSDTSCVYIAVYQASTSTLLNTYGSSGSPLGCANSTTPNPTINTSIASVVSTTTTLNDLRVRVYAYESGGSKPIKIDQATITGSTAYGNFTLYEEIYRDASTGTATTTPWGIASTDGTAYTSLNNLASAFATTRYLKFTFDPAVPAGSVITSATLDFRYKATSPNTACWYFETYNGATLLGTHGSSGTPQSCNATTSYSIDNVTLSELTTVANANALTVKAYLRESGNKKVLFDLVQLNLTYYLD